MLLLLTLKTVLEHLVPNAVRKLTALGNLTHHPDTSLLFTLAELILGSSLIAEPVVLSSGRVAKYTVFPTFVG